MPIENDIEVSKATQKKGGSKITKLLMLLLPILLIAAGGIYFMMFQGNKETNTINAAIATADLAGEQPISGNIVDLDTFTINLADPGASKFLKMTLSLEVTGSKKAVDEVNANMPKIRDIIITVVSSRTYDEIRTERGQTIFKNDIKTRVNAFLKEGRVINVYKKEFVAQGN